MTPRFQRKAIDPAQALVRVRPLLEGRLIPVEVTPVVPGLSLLEWVAQRREEIDRLLLSHRALLFRGFQRQDAAQFDEFVRCSSEGEPLEYVDRTTPRTRLSGGLYTSTIYPASRRINLHNEGTYWNRWPLKLYFCCVKAASTGGQTPIANVIQVLGRLRTPVRERFAELGFMLERNYNDGFGLPWQEVFQTPDPREVERYCERNAIAYEWREGDRLRTRQVRPAIRRHPRSGVDVWFNHAAFFHRTSYPADVLRAMEEELGPEGLPYRTFYGDGSAIPDDVMHEVHAAYEAEKVIFSWQEGDILLLDNMAVAHAREAYTGERLITVAMKEPHGDQAA